MQFQWSLVNCHLLRTHSTFLYWKNTVEFRIVYSVIWRNDFRALLKQQPKVSQILWKIKAIFCKILNPDRISLKSQKSLKNVCSLLRHIYSKKQMLVVEGEVCRLAISSAVMISARNFGLHCFISCNNIITLAMKFTGKYVSQFQGVQHWKCWEWWS